MTSSSIRSTRTSSPLTSASSPNISYTRRHPSKNKSPISTSPSNPTSATRYFLIVASRDHVLTALQGGFCQANHGKKAPLQQMRKGDGVLFYSPRETYTPKSQSKGGTRGKECQRFTAVGRVSDQEIFQVKVSEGFEPWRRRVEYVGGATEVRILPLIEKLEFIRDKKNWGMSLRFGFLKIGEGDWNMVEAMMSGGKEDGHG